MTGTVAYLQAEAEANWIRTNQPEIWERTYKYLFLSGYLTYKLTGRLADSVGCQVGYVPFDYKKLGWAAPSDWKWQAVPMPKEMLVDLVPPAGTIAEITREAAEATGIPAGLPLIAAAADKACEVIGAGCVQPHVGCLSYGTTATINTTHRRYIEVIPLIPPYPAAIPGAYSLEIQVYRGFWMVSWFLEQFALGRAPHRGRAGGPARGASRPPRGAGAGGVDGPGAPAVLDARAEAARAGGQGRDHRLRRRPHPRPRLPGHPGGPRVRPARGQGADGRAQRRQDDRAPGFRRRFAKQRRAAVDGRHLQPPDRSPACLRDFGRGRGDGRGGRARPAPRFRCGGQGNDAGQPGIRAQSRQPRDRTTASINGSTSPCTSTCGRCTRRSGTSPAIRRGCRPTAGAPSTSSAAGSSYAS